MMSKLYYLLPTIVALAIHISFVSGDSYRMLDELSGDDGADIPRLQSQVQEIDNHLEETLPDGAATDSMILDEIRRLSRKDITEDLHQAINVIQRLFKFTSRCDSASFKALGQAYLLIGGEPKELFDTPSIVSNLVLEFAHRHKKRCIPRYGKFYSMALAKFEPSTVRDLEQLFDEEYMNGLHSGISSETTEYLLDGDLKNLEIGIYRSISDILLKIKARVSPQRGFLANTFKTNKNNSPEFYWQYLISRCTSFTDNFGPVFIPARFDSMTFGGQAEKLCQSDMSKFCNHWKIYRICLAHQHAKYYHQVL